MRIGIVVDSTCDLPESYFKKNNIQILPISIRLGKELLVDKRDEQATRRFYQEQLEQLQRQASEDEEALVRVEQMRDLHRSLIMRLIHQELNRIPTPTNQEE